MIAFWFIKLENNNGFDSGKLQHVGKRPLHLVSFTCHVVHSIKTEIFNVQNAKITLHSLNSMYVNNRYVRFCYYQIQFEL